VDSDLYLELFCALQPSSCKPMPSASRAQGDFQQSNGNAMDYGEFNQNL